MHYWERTGADPRPPSSVSASLRNYVFKAKAFRSYSQIENLCKYFSSIKKKEKARILGKLDEITQDYLVVKNRMSSLSTRFINCSALPLFMPTSLYPLSSSFLPCCFSPMSSFYSYTAKTRIKYYQSAKSAEFILQQFASLSDFKFVEFLFCSPMDRSVTMLDVVARKALYRIINAYTEKNAMDLILDESVNIAQRKGNNKNLPGSKVNGKNKHSKSKNNKKNSNNKKSNAGSVPAKDEKVVDVQAEHDQSKAFIEEIVNKIIEDAVKIKETINNDAQEFMKNSSEFQVVSSQKKKNRKSQPQQKSKSSPKKHSKHFRKPKPDKSDPKIANPADLASPKLNPVEPSQTLPDYQRPQQVVDSLHKEVLRFCESITWKLEDRISSINKILEKLSEIVAMAFEGASIGLFGSYASGLAIEASDVDIVVIGLDVADRSQIEISCQYLATYLQNYPFITHLQVIPTARIPIIKLEVNTLSLIGKESQIMVDITFDDSCSSDYGSHFGLSTLYLTKELQKLYPSLQYLVLVLKQFLYEHSLNSSYRGGLSSYSLILWVAALLNSMKIVPENLGELLVEFFKFYGNEFDPKAIGVNILNGGSFFELEYPGYEAVVTIDPVNQLNVTRMSYQISEVLVAFSKAHQILKEFVSKGKKKHMLKSIFKK